MEGIDFNFNDESFSDIGNLPEFDVDLNMDDFKVDANFSDGIESRIIKPPLAKMLPERMITFEKAEEMAARITVEKDMRYMAVVSGNFIFGDFIEALIVNNDLRCKSLTISTLSMSQENIDSLKILMEGLDIDYLNIIISTFFYSHERNNLIKYLYQELDVDNRFQLAVAATHCKVAFFETYCGKFITIHGSANLRSSRNIEQFMVEESKELYDFHNDYNSRILETYATINKSIRGEQLWQVVAKKQNSNR